MAEPPQWLPPMASIDGEWQKVLTMLYRIFEHDFRKASPTFEGRPVWWDRRVLGDEEYEEGFWHLISRLDATTQTRLLDPRRAERLPWCAPTLTNSRDRTVTVWDYEEPNGRARTYLWLRDWDYVIVLEKRSQRLGEIAFLVTAYHVDGESRRRNLSARYAKRKQ